MGNEWVDTGSGPGWPLKHRELTDEEKARLKANEPKSVPVDPPEDDEPAQ